MTLGSVSLQPQVGRGGSGLSSPLSPKSLELFSREENNWVPFLCTNLWLEGLDQLISPSPSSTWGHLPPSPSIWKDYSSYFHPCFLRSHFRAHTTPWGPAGHLGSQGRHHLTALAPAEGPCCGGRRENQFHPKEPWKAAACRGSSVSPASASR